MSLDASTLILLRSPHYIAHCPPVSSRILRTTVCQYYGIFIVVFTDDSDSQIDLSELQRRIQHVSAVREKNVSKKTNDFNFEVIVAFSSPRHFWSKNVFCEWRTVRTNADVNKFREFDFCARTSIKKSKIGSFSSSL